MANKSASDEDKLAGNAEDRLNPGAKSSNDLFNSKGNATSSELASLEADLDKKYSQEFDANDSGESQTAQEQLQEKESSPDSTSSYYRSGAPGDTTAKKNFIQRLVSRKDVRPSAGILTALMFAGGIALMMAGGSSFWVALEKNLTNEYSNDTRTNLVLRRAFNSAIMHSECTTIKLVCKMKTATKEQIKKWKDGFFKVNGRIVDVNGKPTGEKINNIDPDKLEDGQRVAIDEVVAKDNTTLRSGAELNAYTDSNIKARNWFTSSFNMRTADFLHTKFSKLLGKYGLSKARATADEKKLNNATKEVAVDAAKKASEKYDPDKNLKMAALKSASGISNLVLSGGQLACMQYNIVRIAVGVVKAKWTLDIIHFMWPFMRLISKIADGSATESDFNKIEEKFTQLTDYMPPSKASALKDKVTNGSLTDSDKDILGQYGIGTDDYEKGQNKTKILRQIDDVTNKNALDSQGIRMIMYGDNTSLSELTKQFTTAAIGSSVVAAQSWINSIQSAAGLGNISEGKDNIRTGCIAINTIANGASAAQIVKCVAEVVTILGALECLGQAVAGAAIYMTLFQIAQSVSLQIALALMATVPIRDDLRGPAAGDAISAAIGLFLTRKSASNGLVPALSEGALIQFLTSTNQTYNQYGDELAYYNARSNPFDTRNKYSFIGQFISSISPYKSSNTGHTGFSYIANILGAVKNNIIPSASALHSQPVLLTNSVEDLRHRTNNFNCPDFEKKNSGMLCDWNGQAIMYTNPTVLKWAEEDAAGKSDHLTEVVKWMQAEHGDITEGQGPESGTYDETCSELANLLNGEFNTINSCEDSRRPSINEDGSAVEKSQYAKFLQFCTGDRELDFGSSDITTDEGSVKEQDWHTAKQCSKDSYMMNAFTYYYNMCYTQYAVANNVADCTSDQTAAVTKTGDACSILTNPNVVLVQEGTKTALKKLCDTGQATNSCGQPFTINPMLFNTITTLSSKYKIWLNNFGFKEDRYSCDSGQHPKGNGIDINGIEKVGGGKAGGPDWGGITFGDPKQVAIIQEYATDWLASLPPNRGGVGQKGCGSSAGSAAGSRLLSSFNPVFPANATNVNGAAFFPDSCDHLHIDIRDRNNLNAV